MDVGPPITAATPASEARPAPTWNPELPWLQPYPDALLGLAAPGDVEPDAMLASRETIGLVFLAALQHLPPRQRAILVLSDVVGWSAREVAELLDVTVASVTSALQRAHVTMRERLPAGRPDAATGIAVGDGERAALKVFMDAWEQGDVGELTRILREDARWAMPPAPLWFDGRGAIANLLGLFPPRWRGRDFKMVPTGANRQPAAASYLRQPGETAYRLSGVHVLRVEAGDIAEITTFSAELCAGFQLSPIL
jgi:RNA polymerase sigma-70 factor (ECF subfamily)